MGRDQPSLINGLPGLTAGNLDPANVEEIQVIKGPSGTLFGGSFYAYGGMINTTTKKPYFDFGGEVGYSFGSFGLHRVTADVNVRLSKKVAMRINTAYHSEKSFQDAGMKKSFFLAPSLTYNATDRLSFQVMAEVLDISNSSYSAYFSDVVNITPGLMAMVSLRADYFDSKGEKEKKDDDFNQFALSPKFGLIYQPILNKVSLFANYMNAFINVAPQQVSDENGENPYVKSFKPEHANQLEYGVKANLLEDKLHATFSVYDITVSNRVMPDATNPNDVTQGGKVGSRGFELEINATPVKGLDLIAGFSHNHTRVKEGAKDDFYSQPGRAPGGQGPGDLANVWANYRFTQGPLKNFGLGIGGNYASRYKVIDNSATGDFYLPDYALLNAAVSFNSRHFRVSLNVNNITDKEYYIGYWSVNPQRPRNYTANFAYKF